MEIISGLLSPAKYNANPLIEDPFTKELVEIWSCLNFKKQPSDFSNIPIWYNSFVRIDNMPIYYKNWHKAGINFQNDLLDENLHFLTFDAFKEKFSVKTNFLQYQSVVSAVSEMKSICACTQAVTNTVNDLRSFPCFALRILIAHNLWRHFARARARAH